MHIYYLTNIDKKLYSISEIDYFCGGTFYAPVTKNKSLFDEYSFKYMLYKAKTYKVGQAIPIENNLLQFTCGNIQINAIVTKKIFPYKGKTYPEIKDCKLVQLNFDTKELDRLLFDEDISIIGKINV